MEEIYKEISEKYKLSVSDWANILKCSPREAKRVLAGEMLSPSQWAHLVNSAVFSYFDLRKIAGYYLGADVNELGSTKELDKIAQKMVLKVREYKGEIKDLPYPLESYKEVECPLCGGWGVFNSITQSFACQCGLKTEHIKDLPITALHSGISLKDASKLWVRFAPDELVEAYNQTTLRAYWLEELWGAMLSLANYRVPIPYPRSLYFNAFFVFNHPVDIPYAIDITDKKRGELLKMLRGEPAIWCVNENFQTYFNYYWRIVLSPGGEHLYYGKFKRYIPRQKGKRIIVVSNGVSLTSDILEKLIPVDYDVFHKKLKQIDISFKRMGWHYPAWTFLGSNLVFFLRSICERFYVRWWRAIHDFIIKATYIKALLRGGDNVSWMDVAYGLKIVVEKVLPVCSDIDKNIKQRILLRLLPQWQSTQKSLIRKLRQLHFTSEDLQLIP